MTLKLQFIQNGQTVEFVLSQDVTIQVNAAVPTSPVNQITLANAVLNVTGTVPWGVSAEGVAMVVNIPQLKVRADKTTTGNPVAILMLGDKVTVSKTSEKVGKVTWRQIIKPDTYAGKWLGERHDDDTNPYLIEGTTPTYVAPVATASAQSVPGTATAPSAAPVVGDIAPLTGRFSLVQRKGATVLAIDGDPKPKLGVNIREYPYFGSQQWQWTRENWQGSYASSAKGLGMKWVRFFVAHVAYSTDQIIARTRKVLDACSQQGLVAVVTFADSLSEKGMFPKGDEQWHTGSRGHLIKDYFNTGAYRTNYIPFVKAVVTALKDHPGVGMWQLMNELAIYNPPANDSDVANFAAFVDEASAAVYALDTTHPISIGIINTAHIMPPGKNLKDFGKDFYSKRKYIHVVTCHCYQYDNNTNPSAAWEHEENCALDAQIAKETGRAMMWTEFGAMNAGDRRASTERFLNQYFVNGNASAALQWGYMLELDAIPDSGIGDSRYGFSPKFNSHFEQLSDLFKNLPSKV